MEREERIRLIKKIYRSRHPDCDMEEQDESIDDGFDREIIVRNLIRRQDDGTETMLSDMPRKRTQRIGN